MNKRGQGVSIPFLIGIVIAIIVAVIVILGFTQGFDFIFSKFKLVPGQSLETVAQSCNIASKANLKIDYCQEFKKVELDGKEQYVNCQFGDLQGSIDDPLDCDDRSYESEQCLKLLNGDKRLEPKDIIVNGLSCEVRGVDRDTKTCSELTEARGGFEWTTGIAECLRKDNARDATNLVNDLTEIKEKVAKGQKCCVYTLGVAG